MRQGRRLRKSRAICLNDEKGGNIAYITWIRFMQLLDTPLFWLNHTGQDDMFQIRCLKYFLWIFIRCCVWTVSLWISENKPQLLPLQIHSCIRPKNLLNLPSTIITGIPDVSTKSHFFLLFHLLTYSTVQSPSWAANWFAASQEFPRISRNPKVHYRTHKRPSPVSILGQPNPVHIPTSHLLEIHPNIIHPSTPSSPQLSLFLRFPHQDPNAPTPQPYAPLFCL